jgi:hypothetical protein
VNARVVWNRLKPFKIPARAREDMERVDREAGGGIGRSRSEQSTDRNEGSNKSGFHDKHSSTSPL